MPNVVLLTYYCALILLASIVGGMIPVWFRLTHRWMEFAVSFVAGVMLGVGVLHMLPHAIVDAMAVARAEAAGAPAADAAAAQMGAVTAAMLWLLAGMLVMFFIERFFCYHHHDVPESIGQGHDHHRHDAASHHHHGRSGHPSGEHVHDLSWSGAALGLTLHSLVNGVALAAAVQHGTHGSWLAGFGTFLVIFLHKPFDAMMIGTLMARGGWSLTWRHTVNGLFALAIPIGALGFYFGLMPVEGDVAANGQRLFVAYALAFSAGTFLCISLSDLLPELQFHQHDRVKLSLALLVGLGVAYAAASLEAAAHAAHTHPTPPSDAGNTENPGRPIAIQTDTIVRPTVAT